MKKTFLILAIFSAFSASAFADGTTTQPTYVCTAGTTIPKHLASYFGDESTDVADAQASALAECRHESSFGDYCRILSCYDEASLK
jgi:hypothetical protein